MRILLALLVTGFLAGSATAAPSKSGETEITTVIWQNDWTYLVNGKKAKGYNARAVFFYCPKPIYPYLARKAWATGKGIFRTQVGKDGVVASVQIVKSTGHDILDSAAIEAIKQWRAKPGYVRSIDTALSFQLGRG
jgi:TonB family protein